MTIQQCIEGGANAYSLHPKALFLRTRERPIVRARQYTMWLLRNEGFSFPQIAKILGFKDHTTIIHGVRVTEKVLKIKGFKPLDSKNTR